VHLQVHFLLSEVGLGAFYFNAQVVFVALDDIFQAFDLFLGALHHLRLFLLAILQECFEGAFVLLKHVGQFHGLGLHAVL
jgi:hypothetical protein